MTAGCDGPCRSGDNSAKPTKIGLGAGMQFSENALPPSRWLHRLCPLRLPRRRHSGLAGTSADKAASAAGNVRVSLGLGALTLDGQF